jgi:hypothetical protein
MKNIKKLHSVDSLQHGDRLHLRRWWGKELKAKDKNEIGFRGQFFAVEKFSFADSLVLGSNAKRWT